MLKRAGLLVAAALGTAAVVTAGGYFATRPTELSIAVGPPGSEDVRVMTTVGQLLRRDRATVVHGRCSCARVVGHCHGAHAGVAAGDQHVVPRPLR